MRYRTTRSTTITVLLASIAACAVLGLAACGGAPLETSSPRSSSLMMNTLNAPDGGFSIRYPTDYIKLQPPVDQGKAPGLVDQVLLANPRGARQGDSALDVLSITVRRMSRASTAGDLKKHKADFEEIATELIGKPTGLKFISPMVLTKLGGLPALRTDYIFKVDGTDMAAVAYLVPAGDRAYWVAGQASRATWSSSGREIAVALATFSVDR